MRKVAESTVRVALGPHQAGCYRCSLNLNPGSDVYQQHEALDKALRGSYQPAWLPQ